MSTEQLIKKKKENMNLGLLEEGGVFLSSASFPSLFLFMS